MNIEPIYPGLFTQPDDPRGAGLCAGRCDRCGDLHFPATPDCPYCGFAGCREEIVGRTGVLHLGTVVTAPPPGYIGEVPYGFGLVDLPEGLRVVSVVAETDPERLYSGMPLRIGLLILTTADGSSRASWQYEPAEASS